MQTVNEMHCSLTFEGYILSCKMKFILYPAEEGAKTTTTAKITHNNTNEIRKRWTRNKVKILIAQEYLQECKVHIVL